MKNLKLYIDESKVNFLIKGHSKTQAKEKELTFEELKEIVKKWAVVVRLYNYDSYGSNTISIFLVKTSDNQKECGQEPGTLDSGVSKEVYNLADEKFKKLTQTSIKDFKDKITSLHIDVDCFYYKDLLNLGTKKIIDLRFI